MSVRYLPAFSGVDSTPCKRKMAEKERKILNFISQVIYFFYSNFMFKGTTTNLKEDLIFDKNTHRLRKHYLGRNVSYVRIKTRLVLTNIKIAKTSLVWYKTDLETIYKIESLLT